MRSVALVVQDGVHPFGLGTMVEIFGADIRPGDLSPVFDFKVCAPTPGRIWTPGGFDLYVEHDLSVAAEADLVIFSPKDDIDDLDPAVGELARAAYDRGAYVMSHCTGAFQLGHAGLLDGRRCTTHWRYTDRLREYFPEALIDPDVLYVVDDRLITGAGDAAGIDAGLNLIRREFGAEAAAAVARRMVVAPHRDGGQAQFIRQAVPECTSETFASLLAWIAEHLDSDLSVTTLAARALLSERTFARRFVDEVGMTPHSYVTQQRVQYAERLLEQTDVPIEEVARMAGFGSAATMRQQFAKVRGINPQQYRLRFTVA